MSNVRAHAPIFKAPSHMYLHEPTAYKCPFCSIVGGAEEPRTVVWRDATSIAFLALHQHPRNAGALLLCPLQHFENIYVLPEQIGAHLFGVTKRLAAALKVALACDGISTRQHNEPAGNQDVWHYHVHIVPRFKDDNFYSERGVVMPVEQRIWHAEALRRALAEDAL
jgi:histidine triad (HIT) family protein